MAASSDQQQPQQQQSFSMKMVTFGIQKKYPGVTNITCEEFHKMISENNAKLTILDCREATEHSVSYISGSLRVDYEHSEPWRDIDLSTTQKVVCYCSVGYRSSIVSDKLKTFLKSSDKSSSDIKVFNLEGGIFQWVIEGRGLEGEHKERVHPYSSFWGRLLPSHLRHSNL